MRLGLVALLLIAAAACGGGGGGSPAPISAGDACASVIEDARTTVQELVSRLRVGISRDQFDERLGDVQVAVDGTSRADAAAIDAKCGLLFEAFELAPGILADLGESWDACAAASEFIDVAGCDSSTDLLDVTREGYVTLERLLSEVDGVLAEMDAP